jgi:large subunit ribosomal protein L18
MINKKDKNQARLVRHKRVRRKVSGTSTCPRLNVYRSLNEIYAQIIDDTKMTTIVSASSKDKEIVAQAKDLTKTQIATLVGKTVAEKAIKAGIQEVVFDRGGYIYHGVVKELAEAAREGGLVF